jgi:hypothetical protein
MNFPCAESLAPKSEHLRSKKPYTVNNTADDFSVVIDYGIVMAGSWRFTSRLPFRQSSKPVVVHTSEPCGPANAIQRMQ